MTIDRKWALAVSSLALLAGCSPNDTGIGNAVKSNNVAQIVDPEPTHEGAVAADGNQVAGAQQRYRTDNVKKPASVSTTSGSGGSGSSGSGSSSGGN